MGIWQKQNDILGVNARNLLYIGKYNTKLGKDFADDKIFTKNYLQSRGIGVARLYATIRNHKELLNFNPKGLPVDFVIKPNHGSGGAGITIIEDTKNGIFLGVGNKKYTWENLRAEMGAILDGKYAISGLRDQVIIEELLANHESFLDLVPNGLPDIRLIVFSLVPVMAMLRLPTKESAGKANLHMGAVGLGIDIGTGKTTYAVHHGKFISTLPNGQPVNSVAIPQWEDIMLMAVKIQQISKVGFLGVDLALTKTGIKVLEINARAGLNIQIANRAPLKARLHKVTDLKISSPEEGVQVAKTLFSKGGGKLLSAKEAKKPIIGLYEEIELLNTDIGPIRAKIDPHASRNLFDATLQEKIQDKLVDVKIAGKRITLPVEYGNLTKHRYRVILAGKSLTDFLVDTSGKKSEQHLGKNRPAVKSKAEKIIENIDKKVLQLDRQLAILPRLRPINIIKEKELFLQNNAYSPKFIYKKLSIDLEATKKEIKKIPRQVDHPLMPLYLKKIRELQYKVSLLEARGTARVQYYSEKLYGRVDQKLYQQAVKSLSSITIIDDTSPIVPFKKSHKAIKDFLQQNKLSHWRIKVLAEATADISVGKNNFIFIKDGVEFTENRLQSVITHEIETHIFRWENARLQQYRLLEVGTAGYLMTEEGLAIHNVKSLGLPLGKKFIWPALNVIAVYLGRRMTFAQLADHLMKTYAIDPERAWRICLKVKRGLSNTEDKATFGRDFIYYSGEQQVKDFVAKNSEKDLKQLYLGKIGLTDLEIFSKMENDLEEVKYFPPRYSNF